MILDTSALSAFIDGDEKLGDILRRQPRACIPAIVLGEFRYGIAQSTHRAAYDRWLESELGNFELLAVTERTTVPYATLRVALKTRGTPIPVNDAWIAALALQYKLPVLSRDQHFDAVPGVDRQDW